ncbi:hypothetical protein H5410_015357, partial [Solanum commersonii]
MVVVVELNEIVVANTISALCFWLARERGRKTKTTKLIACGSGLTRGSARESGGCSSCGKWVSKRNPFDSSPLPWDSTPTLGWITLLLYDRRYLHWK